MSIIIAMQELTMEIFENIDITSLGRVGDTLK